VFGCLITIYQRESRRKRIKGAYRDIHTGEKASDAIALANFDRKLGIAEKPSNEI
jgi:hypothetical protein